MIEIDGILINTPSITYTRRLLSRNLLQSISESSDISIEYEIWTSKDLEEVFKQTSQQTDLINSLQNDLSNYFNENITVNTDTLEVKYISTKNKSKHWIWKILNDRLLVLNLLFLLFASIIQLFSIQIL